MAKLNAFLRRLENNKTGQLLLTFTEEGLGALPVLYYTYIKRLENRNEVCFNISLL